MRVLLQRVQSSRVTVRSDRNEARRVVAEIGAGVLILLGIGQEDSDPQAAEEHIRYLTEKIVHLRIFEDERGKINRSLLEVGGQAMVVSQFTLYADTRKGRRPSFTDAALPEVARPVIEQFADQIRRLGIPTQTGEFGAHMLVEIANDGPVTIWLERV
jgi:D-tyrosyl-tRNA(Tyr) deacylase